MFGSKKETENYVDSTTLDKKLTDLKEKVYSDFNEKIEKVYSDIELSEEDKEIIRKVRGNWSSLWQSINNYSFRIVELERRPQVKSEVSVEVKKELGDMKTFLNELKPTIDEFLKYRDYLSTRIIPVPKREFGKKIGWEKVEKVIELRKDGVKIEQISKEVGVSTGTISMICKQNQMKFQ